VRRVLILRDCCLGDLLMATPLVRALRTAWPEVEVDVAVGPWARSALLGHPAVHEVVPYPKLWKRRGRSLVDSLRGLGGLRARRYDATFTLEVGFQPSLLAWASGAPRRFGYRFEGRRVLHTDIVEREVNDRYEAEAHLELARLAGVEPQGLQLDYPVPEEASREVHERLAEAGIAAGDFVALVPGGGANPGTVMPEKRWPATRFAELARMIREGLGLAVVLVGGGGDVPACRAIAEAVGDGVHDWCPAGSVPESAAVLAAAGAVVSNDSFGMHLAAAVGAPLVALFGPTDPETVAPRGEHVRVVSSPVPPCYKQILGTFEHVHARDAMFEISAGEVFEAVEELLGGTPQ
jgi:lipopolysaccharide heptosyltransferase II